MEAAAAVLSALAVGFLVRKMLLDLGLFGGRDCGCGKCESEGRKKRR